MSKYILFIVNDASFFLSHRLPLALAARRAGFKVVVACPWDEAAGTIAEHGFPVLRLAITRGSSAVLSESAAVFALYRLLRREKPDLVHLITSKPVIYGGVLARLLSIPAVTAISGLGHVFVDKSWRSRLIRRAAMFGYSFALRGRRCRVIFQNPADMELFVRAGAARPEQSTIIPGSGVNLEVFDASPAKNEKLVCMLPARLLKTKGIEEYVEAARRLKPRFPNVKFVLQGDPDPANPASIKFSQLAAWEGEGIIEWWRHSANIPEFLRAADIVVLPSYREGFPKSLIDAAAAGRPVVTTDVAGCRDAIIDGVTGLLCRPRDAGSLGECIAMLLDDRQRRETMGAAGRQHAEQVFNIEDVVQRHISLYAEALA